MHCPDCHSEELVKNGFNSTNKQMYRCKQCGRQFVLNPEKSPISYDTKQLIDKLQPFTPSANYCKNTKLR